MFQISTEAIHSPALQAELVNPQAGAEVIFAGLVRNHNQGHAVSSLEYECFAELAMAEADKIITEARERFEIYDLRCVHRVGHLQIGETAVWIGVTSAHRAAAFAACQYLIDEIKRRLPIWKKEHYLDRPAIWVNCQQCGGPSEHEH